MSTPPLLQLPSSSCIASVTISLVRTIGRTESPFTLQSQTFRWPGERWMLDFALPPITNKLIAGQWKAFGAALKGGYGLFLMGDPLGKQPMGLGGGTPVVNGGGQEGNLLLTRGWPVSAANVLLPGDYLQVGSGENSRLHMVTEAVSADSSGEAAISIEPALRFSPADGDAVVIENAKGVFCLSSNTFAWSASPGPVWRISLQAMEKL